MNATRATVSSTAHTANTRSTIPKRTSSLYRLAIRNLFN